jgi:hypothetical protein
MRALLGYLIFSRKALLFGVTYLVKNIPRLNARPIKVYILSISALKVTQQSCV